MIGLEYLLTTKSPTLKRLVMPCLVNNTKLESGSSNIIQEITLSSALIGIILLICLPISFHLASCISWTGTYK